MTFLRKRRLRVTLRTARRFAAAIVASFAVSSIAFGDEPAPTARPAATAPLLVPSRPYWPELTVPQRQALAPLADDWERLDVQTKKKWLEIAKRYPKMQPEEQLRTRDRMREWALLTPDQRRVARDSFARMQAMPPEQRAEVLRKYQELPDEKKQALKTEGRAVKPLIVPKQMPAAAPVPRRAQIREGTTVNNPAVAAQKSASPVARPVAPKPPPAAEPAVTPAPAAPSPTPGTTPAAAGAPAS